MSSIVSNVTREEVLDEIIPKRMIHKTREKLEEIKSKNKKTKLVHSKDFGFKGKLSMYVYPDLPDDEIIKKFEARLSESNINMFRKNFV